MGVIRGLDRYLRDRRLVHSTPLGEFRGCVMGVDAVAWFKATPVVKEALLSAVGGPPIALGRALRSQMEALGRAGIRPLFVFGGLIPPKRGGASAPKATSARGHRPQQHQPPATSKASAKRHEAWQAHEDGQTRTASYLFAQSGGYVSLDVQQAVLRALREAGLGGSHFRSPYAAASQLAWMTARPQSYAHAAFGGLELLMYGVPRVVLEMKGGRAEWVSLPEVLSALGLTHDQFVDMCLLAGYGRCRTFDPVVDENRRFEFGRAREYVLAHGSADAAVAATLVSSAGYLGMLRRSRVLVRHGHVLQPGCVCAPMVPPAGDLDRELLAAAVGPSFPPEVYAALVKGAASPQVLNNLLNGVLVDSAPAVDSREYAAFLDFVAPLRRATFCAMHHALRRRGCETGRAVANRRWYDPAATSTLFSADVAAPAGDAADALFAAGPGAPARAALARAAAAAAPAVSGAYGALAPLALLGGGGAAAASAVADADPLAEAAVALLALTGFVELPPAEAEDGTVAPTELGRAALAAGAGSGAAADEALLLATQLVRAGALTGEPVSLLTPEGRVFYASVPSSDGRVPLSRPARLVAQVCSLCPLRCAPAPGAPDSGWAGPVDRELAAFGAVAKALQRCARNLVESLALAQALDLGGSDAADSARRLVSRLEEGGGGGGGVRLPLASETGSAMGMVVRDFVAGGAGADELRRRYPNATHAAEDVGLALAHWCRVVRVVRAWPAAAASRPLFDEADAFVRSALGSRGIDLDVVAAGGGVVFGGGGGGGAGGDGGDGDGGGTSAKYNDRNFWATPPTLFAGELDDLPDE